MVYRESHGNQQQTKKHWMKTYVSKVGPKICSRLKTWETWPIKMYRNHPWFLSSKAVTLLFRIDWFRVLVSYNDFISYTGYSVLSVFLVQVHVTGLAAGFNYRWLYQPQSPRFYVAHSVQICPNAKDTHLKPQDFILHILLLIIFLYYPCS